MTKGIILVAGRGSRMEHFTNDLPKCFVKLHGKRLIDIQIEAFKQAGVFDIGLITGYKKESFLEFDLPIFYNPEWKTTNMVETLSYASEWLKKEHCIISYGDIFYEDIAIKLLLNIEENIAITYDPNWYELWKSRFNNPLEDAETFKYDSMNFLTKIGNKTDRYNDIDGQYMGLLSIFPKGWKLLNNTRLKLTRIEQKRIDITKLLNYFIDKSENKVKVVPYFGKWGELDTVDDYKLYSSRNFYKI